MTDVPDARLLEQFARNGSEEAFAALVQRHIALVHSVALRHTANPQHAQDITQAVFVILARKAGSLGRKTVLPGWLYHTARLTAANLQRAETSRIRREQEAFMQSQLEESVNDALWRELSPQLDEAMAGLGTSERDALVLRYFQNKSMAEVGEFLGLEENTAQKRVGRALETLRTFFAKRGVSSTKAIIAGAISANSVQAVPVALTKAVTAIAVTKGAAASASTLTLIKGALKIMAWTKMKTAVISGVVVLLAVGTTTAVIQHQHLLTTGNDVSRAAWVFSGYGDPKSAMLTFLHAIRQADGEQILAACTPELQQEFQKRFEKQMRAAGKTLGEFLAQDAPARFQSTTGIRIIELLPVSADRITLRVLALGEGKEHPVTVRKIGDEWKVDQVFQ